MRFTASVMLKLYVALMFSLLSFVSIFPKESVRAVYAR